MQLPWYRLYQTAVVVLLLLAFAGCQAVEPPPAPSWGQSPASDSMAETAGLLFHGEGAIEPEDPLVDELITLRARIAEELNIPASSRKVHVHIFPDSSSYRAYAAHAAPSLRDRRAMFLEEEGRLMVFAQRSPYLAEDLRHEVTHGYLHAALGDVPLWLDEGLAEFFERPRVDDGWHEEYLTALTNATAAGWQPDLMRLERLVHSSEMSHLDYAEAWAWTYWMLRQSPTARPVLHAYLQQLRQSMPTNSLRVELAVALGEEPAARLVAFLQRRGSPLPAVASAGSR